MEPRSPVVGRDAERELLVSALHDSATGTPRAVLVAGEAGIGKTRLVADVADDAAADGHLVLWGHCMRFGAESSPYLPIGQVLTQWHRTAGPQERRRVLAGAAALSTIAPALGGTAGTAHPDGTSRLIPLTGAVVDRITEEKPLVLVVDDLQWADATSLDLLAYLISGFAPARRLALLATFRDTDLEDGHRLHGWLADMLRLPGVATTRLERLDLQDTEHLVSSLRGGTGIGRLSHDVFERSEGNPYLTEVLVRSNGERTTSAATTDLSTVLLASWHRLTPQARALMQWLAVGGRPVRFADLEQVAAGIADDRFRTCLEEARAEGIVRLVAPGVVWFHHPLLAEVIADTMGPGELRTRHARYVDVLEAVSEDVAADTPDHSRAAHLALHHEGAGHTDEALRWSLLAADAAERVRAFAEATEHLQRVCRLWPEASDRARAAAGERVPMLTRASDSARRSGDHLAAVRLREEAVSLVDARAEPELAVELSLLLPWLRVSSGLDDMVRQTTFRDMLSLLEGRPSSSAKAQVLAHASYLARWDGAPDAARLAERALAMARDLGSERTLAHVMSATSLLRVGAPESLAAIEEAVALAWRIEEPRLIGMAEFCRADALYELGRATEAADQSLAAFRRMVERGWFHDAAYGLSATPALYLCTLGRWPEARAQLRELLGRRQAPRPASWVRSVAAVLAFRAGEADLARTHLTRSLELASGPPALGELSLLAVLEQHAFDGGHERVLDLVEAQLPEAVGASPAVAEDLLVRAARAAGELASFRGHRSDAGRRLHRMESRVAPERGWFARRSREDHVSPALRCVYAAERARCQDDRGPLVGLWSAAEVACAEAGLPWDRALACYHLGQALLERHDRSGAAGALRTAASLATDLGAAPVVADVHALAAQAHLCLDRPAPASDRDGAQWPTLTHREREVLAHVVAGRTYAEIADVLVISPKTVSVHVSNLLRKTDTANRIELAALARRA
ncbi:helix-turn-helix transcriptional regulator [Nocardioides donggukensis]|uniref:AAA family ATPase n=1 Tax=Nocardioides donggukensis TaxID=2774019 RepID=A0A927K8T0_9ACTN|nr:AAA family ATPase [Nocardioides donggukensis]MBD8869861.1 AAA family ATPase [Nocardioides donggukensis]